MKTTFTHIFTSFQVITFVLFALYGCQKEDTSTGNLPVLTTVAISSISEVSALSGGEITDDKGSSIISRGVCWSIVSKPSISDNKTEDSSGKALFTSTITNLAPNTTYYVRAYATNKAGTSYGNEVSFTTLEKGSEKTFTDFRDGKVYAKVVIGNQEWMVDNLAYAPSTGNYWPYNNNDNNIQTYGYLYDWETAVNVCPLGWHLPTDEEWSVLSSFVGETAGGKLKATGTLEQSSGLWLSPNLGATNESGFNALPGGIRNPGGSYADIGKVGTWWTSTEFNEQGAWFRTLLYVTSNVSRSNLNKLNGFSVRCVRD
jgi:uncharacterized protein (TIGR02145 family)